MIPLQDSTEDETMHQRRGKPMPCFQEIVDLGHELSNGMPNLGGNIVAFWLLETLDSTRRMSGGKLAI
jgi:hypothetical protein